MTARRRMVYDSRPKQTPRKRDVALAGQFLGLWAWVELNYRPHAYQAGS
jgi:hypothetical protein